MENKNMTTMHAKNLQQVSASQRIVGAFVKLCTYAFLITMALIVLAVRATIRGDGNIVAFRRNLSNQLVRRALAVMLIAFAVMIFDAVAISLMQPELDFMDVLFECASAVGTVGVSAFGSAKLAAASRILIILTMYMGRIGPLSVALVLAHKQGQDKAKIRYPEGHIMIG